MLDRLVIFFGYGARGILLGMSFLIVCLILNLLIPDEVMLPFGGFFSLSYIHLAMLFIGSFGGLSLMIDLWIKDWKRGYIPSWLLD